MRKIYFKFPSKEELKYCQRWLMDPNTISYNAGYDIDLSGYNKLTGTINKTDKDMMITRNMYFNK